MNFEWLTLLNVASDLLMQEGEEYVRTSINRSYYAIFGKARAILEENEKRTFPSQSVHKEVIEFLKQNSDPVHRQVGYDLDRLRRERVNADYRRDMIIKRETALKVHVWAERVKTKLLAMYL